MKSINIKKSKNEYDKFLNYLELKEKCLDKNHLLTRNEYHKHTKDYSSFNNEPSVIKSDYKKTED